MKQLAKRRTSPRPRSTCPSSNPPAKPATTERRSTASNSNNFGVHSVCIGVTSDRRETVAAQRFSQILSPDAPSAFEKSRLGVPPHLERGGSGSEAGSKAISQG